MRLPTIFLSSTIYDFHDLRSAVKDYLELRGCTVYASDYNDFAKELDQHSYDECLRTVERCDLFVLFIGSRVGGLVDAATKKSITRAEYERAYELAVEGRLRIVSFVRNEVWTHRESVKEMQRFLKSDESAQREIDLTKAPTKFMTDTQTIINFIETVSRNAETSKAVQGEGQFPIANWLHRFSTFGEIRAVLDPLILGGLDVSQALGRRALLVKLKALLQQSVFNLGNGAVAPVNIVEKMVASTALKIGDISRLVEVEPKMWGHLVMLSSMISTVDANDSPFIQNLTDRLLFSYDPATGTFNETPEQHALTLLVSQIASFNKAKAGFDMVKLVQGKNANRPPIMVEGDRLSHALHLLLSWASMYENALALAVAMEGHPFVPPRKLPIGPFVDQQAGLENERVTSAHVDELIAKRIKQTAA